MVVAVPLGNADEHGHAAALGRDLVDRLRAPRAEAGRSSRSSGG